MQSDSIENILHIKQQGNNSYVMGLLQGTAYSRLHTYLTRTLVPFTISIPEWKLLGQLQEHGKMKLAILAEYLSYDPPMVTKLAKQLEHKQLVLRAQDEIDERAKVIVITEHGKKLIESIEPEVKKTMAKILVGVSREEMSAYIRVLIAIVNNTQA